MKRIHILISGYVHGVGFRYFVQKKAKILNIKGWVKNNNDESVEIVAEGEDNNIDSFIEYCKMGPSPALVKNVEVHEESPQLEFKEFSIRF